MMHFPTFAKITALLILATSPSTAHFYLTYPPSIGFNDALETHGPCGGFTVDFSKDNVTNFYVDGNAIAVQDIHIKAKWLFRATLDLTGSRNWTKLLPIVGQNGLGDFCETNVKVPSTWAGKQGIIGVVQDSPPDRFLYQCAAVNFVSGTIQSLPSSCKNVTGLSATYTTDPGLSSLATNTLSSTSSSISTSVSGTSTATTSASGASTASSSASSAISLNTNIPYGVIGTLFWMGILILGTFGFFLVL